MDEYFIINVTMNPYQKHNAGSALLRVHVWTLMIAPKMPYTEKNHHMVLWVTPQILGR